MFSWITGSRITDVAEDLRQDHNEASHIEPPETPAHLFAVKAFKQVLFGTPQPKDADEDAARHQFPNGGGPTKGLIQRADHASNNVSGQPDRPSSPVQRLSHDGGRHPIEETKKPLLSPSKPAGILMTPGTVAARRKTVSFGAQVVDNEGKRAAMLAGRSGLPHNCPGKFPSPWTPKVTATAAAEVDDGTAKSTTATAMAAGTTSIMEQPLLSSEGKPRTKLTAALYEVRESAEKARRDSKADTANTVPEDKTSQSSDTKEPTSSSASSVSETENYWKDQFQSYSERSKKEVRKLVAKQKLAKEYARTKDAEAMELATKLKTERKRHRLRELELEAQVKDHQERLRQLMAENLRCTTEISALKQRLESTSLSLPSSASVLSTSGRHQDAKVPETIKKSPPKPAAGDKENNGPSWPADQQPTLTSPPSLDPWLQNMTSSPSATDFGTLDKFALPIASAPPPSSLPSNPPRQLNVGLQAKPDTTPRRKRRDRDKASISSTRPKPEPKPEPEQESGKAQLPADRAAAARARIEMRRREKENTRFEIA